MATYNPYLENPLFYGYGREHRFFNDLPPSPLDSISPPNTPATPPLPQAQSPLDAPNSEGGPNIGVPGAGVNNQFGSLGGATGLGNFVGSGMGALLGVPGVGQLVGGLVGAGMGATAAQLANQALTQLGLPQETNFNVGRAALSGAARGATGALGGLVGLGQYANDAISAVRGGRGQAGLEGILGQVDQIGKANAQDAALELIGMAAPQERGNVGYGMYANNVVSPPLSYFAVDAPDAVGQYSAPGAALDYGGVGMLGLNDPDGPGGGGHGTGTGSAGHGAGSGEDGGGMGTNFAGGGEVRGGLRVLEEPRMVRGPGGGLDDLIPMSIEGRRLAKLSNNEFIIPADVVSAMGDGSSDEGGRRLYDMIKEVRRQKYGTEKQPGRLKMGPLYERIMA